MGGAVEGDHVLGVQIGIFEEDHVCVEGAARGEDQLHQGRRIVDGVGCVEGNVESGDSAGEGSGGYLGVLDDGRVAVDLCRDPDLVEGQFRRVPVDLVGEMRDVVRRVQIQADRDLGHCVRVQVGQRKYRQGVGQFLVAGLNRPDGAESRHQDQQDQGQGATR